MRTRRGEALSLTDKSSRHVVADSRGCRSLTTFTSAVRPSLTDTATLYSHQTVSACDSLVFFVFTRLLIVRVLETFTGSEHSTRWVGSAPALGRLMT